MRNTSYWKAATAVAVLVTFTALGVYPLVANAYGITSPAWLVDRALKLGLDLKGGVHLVLKVETDYALRLEIQTAMERFRESLRTQAILVQLPGVTDVERAKQIIRSTGVLELKILEGGPAPTRAALMQNDRVPEGMMIVPGRSETSDEEGTVSRPL